MIKRLLLILVAVVLLVAGWFVYSFYFRTKTYEKLLGEKLETAVTKGTDSLYRLEYEHVLINPLSLSVALKGMRLYPDSMVLARNLARGDTPVILLDLHLKNLSFRDLSAKSLLADKELILSSVIVEEAEIEIRKTGSRKKESGFNTDSLKAGKMNLYKMFSAELKRLQIDSVRLLKTHFHYKSYLRKYKEFSVGKLDITLRNILLDSNSVLDRNRFFLAESCSIGLEKYEMPLSDLYTLETASLRMNIPEGNAVLKDLKLKPRHSEKGFSAKVVTDRKRVALHFPELHLQGLDAARFFEEEVISARKLSTDAMAIDVYHNRHSPKDTIDKMGEYPHQLLQDLKLGLHISEIEVKNANVVYRQDNPNSMQQGKLRFSNINALISNVSNLPDSLKKNPVTRMYAWGMLLGKTRLNSLWRFYNLSDKGEFSIEGNLEAIDAVQLNEVLIPFGMVRFDQGKLNSLKFQVMGNDFEGRSKVTFFYENLKVAVLEREDQKIEKQRSKTLIANGLLINEDSRPGDKIPDQLEGKFKRDRVRNIFHLAWNALLAGMKETLQYGKPAAKLLKAIPKREQP